MTTKEQLLDYLFERLKKNEDLIDDLRGRLNEMTHEEDLEGWERRALYSSLEQSQKKSEHFLNQLLQLVR